MENAVETLKSAVEVVLCPTATFAERRRAQEVIFYDFTRCLLD